MTLDFAPVLFQRLNQKPRVQRLGEPAVHTALANLQAEVLWRRAADREYFHPLLPLADSNFADHGGTITTRHPHVDQCESRTIALGQVIERFAAITEADHVVTPEPQEAG